ncbi:MAG: MFS transporter [Thermomicrobiales bacterium]
MSALLPPRVYRWNFTVMGLDLTLFVLGINFASVYGILPLFVHHLSASNLALGAIPALRAANLLPPLFVAGFTERLARKKPFVIGWTIVERLPYLALALATPLLATTRPTALLWLLFAMIALSTLAGGVATPAWLDLLSRMFPADWRGRFFGLSSALGGLLGVAGSAGAAYLLAHFGWSTGGALCFACTFVCLAISFVFIALGREPPPAPRTATVPVRAVARSVWRRLPALIRADGNLRRYLLTIALVTCAGAAAAFYVVDAKRSLGLTDAEASLFAVLLLIAATVGSIVWGYIGDHRGHKRVVVAGAACTGGAALVALVARHAWGGVAGYCLVFVLVGLGSSALQLASLTFIVDFAPPEQRPTFIGVAMLTQAPFAFGAPVLAATIADRWGYPTVFILTALLGTLATLVVARYVRDPRADTLAVRSVVNPDRLLRETESNPQEAS